MGTNVPNVKLLLGLIVPIGDRLREERERLGLNQTDFAALGGVGRKSQFNYEESERQPDAAYLAAISVAGADVLYILTGQRQGKGIGESAVHQAVLEAVDLLSLEKKVDANQLAKAVTKLALRSVPVSTVLCDDHAAGNASPQPAQQASKYSVDFGNSQIGQVVQGDMTGGVNIVDNRREPIQSGKKK
ncbi:helix-turn-helix domain-containing protein [Chromobacterium violaceum]|uniref:helix-turn-helix domain-containing protein n=1 Tax=Chromobacterium violaceum TaxID=536 RepID=UPI0009B8FB36|nr:helix-turn-helix transcriptional regulator [Chromobacterium violaceum]